MQPKIIIVIVLISIAQFADAQEIESVKKRKAFGIQFGYSSYTLFGSQVDLEARDDAAFVERKKGIKVDLDYRQMITNSLFFQGGLTVVQKGGHHKSTGFTDPARAEISYLQIPILLGFTGKGSPSKFGIYTGFAANFEIGSKNTTTGAGWISDSFAKNDLIPSIILGGFFEHNLNKKMALNLDFRYDRDLGPLIERSRNDESFKIKIQGYSISTGLKFNLD